jgi:hypothetical protein
MRPLPRANEGDLAFAAQFGTRGSSPRIVS